MKKVIPGVFLGFLLIVFITPSFAETKGWTQNSTVEKLVVTFNGGINVRLKPDIYNCVSQSGYGPYYASIYPDHPGIDRMKSDLLLAYATGKPISLYLSNEECKVGELILGGW